MLSSLSQFLNSLEDRPIAITVSDPDIDDCPLIFVNKEFEVMTGYGRDQVLGRNCRFLQGENTDRNAVTQLRIDLAESKSCTAALTNYRADGTKFNNLIIIEPVHINPDKKLFFGCQYEFGAENSEGEIIDHLSDISDALSHEDSVIAQSRQIVARSMDARARVLFTLIRNQVSQ